MKNLGINPTRDVDRTLTEFCRSRGLDSRTVARMLAAMRHAMQHVPAACMELMTLAQLCDHLESAHRNLHSELKRLDRLTKALAKKHATEHPKLLGIRKCFLTFQRRFKTHLRTESRLVFPVIRQWESGRNDTRRACFSFKSPLAQLEREHCQADEALADLRILVADDSRSSSGQAAMRTIAEAVARLERAVHEQIYKENRILFPRALPMRGVARVRM